MRRRMKDGAQDAYASQAHVCFFFVFYIDYTNVYLQIIQYNYSCCHHHHHLLIYHETDTTTKYGARDANTSQLGIFFIILNFLVN
jgi:hypothetical protein